MSNPFFTLSDLGLGVSQAQLLQTWLAAMQAAYPGYTPSASNLEYVQAQIGASQAADLATQTAAGSTEMFRQFGTQLINLPYQQGVAAQTTATVTAADTAGHTLPAGTQVTLTLNGATVAFQTVASMTIANGSSSGTVTLIAVQAGTAFNAATNPAALVSQINWVTGISVSAPASGGVDQENDDQYLQRLASTLALQAPRPITASDYGQMALNFTPAPGTDQQLVGRAVAIDGYDPGSNTFGNQREVAVCVTDSSGNALNNDTMYGIGGSSVNIITNPSSWGIAGWLQSLRELNFIVNVVAPNYTTIYGAVTVKGIAGYATSTIQANVQTALLAYLTPANFGLPQGANVGWNNTTSVYRSKVTQIIQGALGVDHVVTGTLAIDVNPTPTNTSNDLVLPGPFPLPVSSITSIPTSAITVT